MEEREVSKKTQIIGIIVQIAVFIAILISVSFHFEIFNKETSKETVVAIANAVTIPSVVYLTIGVLSFTSSKGSFDAFGYMFSKFSFHNLIPSRQKMEKTESFYDYTVRKAEKRKGWLKFMFFVGLAGQVIALILSFISDKL